MDNVLEEEYFYSLIRPKGEKKKRSCLRCKLVFLSKDSGNRTCSTCQTWIDRQAERCKYVIAQGNEIDKNRDVEAKI